MKLESGEEPCSAAVFGTIYAEPVAGDNEVRKILVLYNVDADTFFLGAWPAWRRIPKVGLGEEFDCDNDTHVQTIGREASEAMVGSFSTSASMQAIASRRQAVGQAAEPPPKLKVQRAKEKEDEREREREREREQKEREKKERREQREQQKQNQKGGGGTGGGKGGGGSGRGGGDGGRGGGGGGGGDGGGRGGGDGGRGGGGGRRRCSPTTISQL